MLVYYTRFTPVTIAQSMLPFYMCIEGDFVLWKIRINSQMKMPFFIINEQIAILQGLAVRD